MFNKDILQIITRIVYKSKFKRYIEQYHSIFYVIVNNHIIIKNTEQLAFNYRNLYHINSAKDIWKLCKLRSNCYIMLCTNYHINKNYTL